MGDSESGGGEDWELAKENAMPIKRGRDPKKMRSFLGNAGPGERQRMKSKLENEQDQFEDQLVSARSDGHMEDPLSVWIKYIRWMQESYPAGSSELLSVLERCCREFKDDERYRNNEKYLKVWIGKADLLANPSEVFKYLRENKIGEKLALYYIATAWTAERRGDYSLAEKAYQVGIDKKAQPSELLVRRQREFMRRMSRRWLDQAEKERNGEVAEEDAEETAIKERRLRTISKRQAQSMHRPIGESSGTRNLNNSRARGGGLISRGGGNEDENKAPGVGFAVFQETVSLAPTLNDWGADGDTKKPSSRLAYTGQSEQSKENTLEAGAWTEAGLNKPRPSVTRGRETRQNPPATEHFDVFVDSPLAEQPSGARKDVRGEGATSTEPLLRERVGKKKTETEQLIRKPLSNFKKEGAAPTTRSEVKNKQNSLKEAPEPAPSLEAADQDDMTINTRLAKDDMFDLFGSPSMNEVLAKPPPPAAISNTAIAEASQAEATSAESNGASSTGSAIPFSVFQDTPSPEARAAQQGPSATLGDSRPAFPIFSIDEAAQDVNDGDHTASSRIFSALFNEDVTQEIDDTRESSDEQEEDRENIDLQGKRAANANTVVEDVRALKELDPEVFGFDRLSLEEQSAERGLLDDDEEEEILGGMDTISHEPEGFRVVPAEPKDDGFVIFQDKGEEAEDEESSADRSFSFAPLEAILEASSEADENLNSSESTGARGKSAKKPAFTIFQE